MGLVSLIPCAGMRTVFAIGLAALACATAIPASAGIPSPATSIVDHVIIGSYTHLGAVQGNVPCLATATRGFDVYVRDFANNPVPGALVQIIFAGTGTSIRPYRNQWPGASAQCGMHELDVTADASGHASFVPRFGRYGESPVVPVYANGILLAMIEARSPDYNDDGQVDLVDLGIFAADYLDSFGGHPRSDFDDCPSTKLPDLGFFANEYMASQMGPIEPVCP